MSWKRKKPYKNIMRYYHRAFSRGPPLPSLSFLPSIIVPPFPPFFPFLIQWHRRSKEPTAEKEGSPPTDCPVGIQRSLFHKTAPAYTVAIWKRDAKLSPTKCSPSPSATSPRQFASSQFHFPCLIPLFHLFSEIYGVALSLCCFPLPWPLPPLLLLLRGPPPLLSKKGHRLRREKKKRGRVPRWPPLPSECTVYYVRTVQ